MIKKLAYFTGIVATTFSLQGATILLYNTGVDNAGNLLGNTTVDPHYSLVSAPSQFTTTSLYTGTGLDTQPMPWLNDGPNSRWIGVTPWMGEWRPAGTYTFRLSFDLSGMIPETAFINLNVLSDNNCSVFLNGVYTGFATPYDSFTTFSSFLLNTGFIEGVNTLDFQITEAGNTPSGLRVELSGQAALVPEPSAVALGSMAGVLLLLARARRLT